MKKQVFLLLLIFLTSLASQARPDKYWWVCYTWPDGSEQCDSKRSKTDPCAYCPCYAPDADGNSVEITCESEHVDGINLKDPTYGFALDYKGNTLYCTEDNTVVLDCTGTDVELCDFDTFIDNYGDSAVLVYSLSLDGSNNFTLTIKEEDPENPGTYITASEYTFTATEAVLDNACVGTSPTSSTEGSVFDKILMSKKDLFTVYPNPAQDHVKIKWPSKANNIKGTSFTFVLYNMAGTEIKRIKISNEVTELSLENLSAEIYAYKVFLNNETKIEYNKGLITIIRE